MGQLSINPVAYGRRLEFKHGQSLAEILVGIAVVAVVIASALPLLSVTLKTGTKSKYLQTASFLAQELANELTVYAEREWYCPPGCVDAGSNPANYGLYNLTKGSNYYLIQSGNTFVYSPGTQIVCIDGGTPPSCAGGTAYTRYFFSQNVCRSGGDGNIVSVTSGSCSGSIEDKSTQYVTVIVTVSAEGPTQTVSLRKFLTRHGKDVFRQSDWSGGGTTPALEVLQTPDNQFFASNNIKFSGAGSIEVNAAGAGDLESSVFDTCPSNTNCGASFNTILWQGTQTNGSVNFRIASSDNSTGPWNFYGPNSSTVTYYTPGYTPVINDRPAVITSEHNNKRYVRYKVYLQGASPGDPVVNDIIINWSP